jgi:hypothetical protein
MDLHNLFAVTADIYSPALLLGIAIIMLKQPHAHRQALLAAIVAYLMGVYGLMLVDKAASLWQRVGLDHSTHTAFAAACVWFLWKHTQKPWRAFWLWSLAAYFALMIHLGYHTAADILSTMTVTALWIVMYDLALAKRRKIKTGNLDSSQTQAYERDPHRDHQ